jgi:hypothetical protein
VLDDHRERTVGVLGGELQRGVGVEQVVVGQLLAGQLPRRRQAPRPRRAWLGDGVERRRLVRVLAVAERLLEARTERQDGRQLFLAFWSGPLGEPGGDGGVVGRDARERAGG